MIMHPDFQNIHWTPDQIIKAVQKVSFLYFLHDRSGEAFVGFYIEQGEYREFHLTLNFHIQIIEYYLNHCTVSVRWTIKKIS